MTLKAAIRNMNATEAAKRPSMVGYVYKDTEGLTEDEIGEGKYRLVFVGKGGERKSFPMGGIDDSAPAATIVADREFIANVIEDNWEVASRADLEAARAGKGNW